MDNNSEITSIKKTDVDKLIEQGKIYATRNDMQSGNAVNVNSEYFDEDNWGFDDQGRLVEIQQDGSQVVMGWINKDDVNTGYSGPGGMGRNESTGDLRNKTTEPGGMGKNSSTAGVTNRSQTATATGTSQMAGNTRISAINISNQPQDLTGINKEITDYNHRNPQDLTDMNKKVDEYNNRTVDSTGSWTNDPRINKGTETVQQNYSSQKSGIEGAVENFSNDYVSQPFKEPTPRNIYENQVISSMPNSQTSTPQPMDINQALKDSKKPIDSTGSWVNDIK